MKTERIYPTATAVLLLAVAAGPACSQSRLDPLEFKTDFSKHTVPLDEIVSGGPPKDGIPAIDDPKFEDVGAAERWLADREPVVVVTADGVAKAYPLKILIWHEIVNDVVGDLPVSITFCPLCNTALAFDRRFDGKVLDFGTTGRLRHSDLVMYDRQTETWWQQATGEGIVGEYAGEQLTFVSSPLVSWGTFRDRYPDGHVLSRDSYGRGYQRRYGRNPYEGYDTGSEPWRRFFFARRDRRLPAMERIVAIEVNHESIAVPFSVLAEHRVVDGEVGDTPVTVFWAPGTASALDTEDMSRGRDVGSSGVFDRRVDGRSLSFEAAGDGRFRDRETGTTWDILGRGIEGPLAGQQLSPVVHGNHFWFAWGVFKPETRIVEK